MKLLIHSQTSKLHHWRSLGMHKLFYPTLYDGCNYLSMLGSNLIMLVKEIAVVHSTSIHHRMISHSLLEIYRPLSGHSYVSYSYISAKFTTLLCASSKLWWMPQPYMSPIALRKHITIFVFPKYRDIKHIGQWFDLKKYSLVIFAMLFSLRSKYMQIFMTKEYSVEILYGYTLIPMAHTIWC